MEQLDLSIVNKDTEKEKILRAELAGETDNVQGIRVMGLSKTYKSIISNKETEALRNVFFNI